QTMSPRGPISAPRSPSAISAYSRSTCGGNASAVDGTVTGATHLLRRHRLPVRGAHKPGCRDRAHPPEDSVRRSAPRMGPADAGASQAGGGRDVWGPPCPVGEWPQGNRRATTGGTSGPAGSSEGREGGHAGRGGG